MKQKLLCALCLVICLTACTTRPEQVLDEDWVKKSASEANAVLSRRMIGWKGETPNFDGQIGKEEYADASHFIWTDEWVEAMRQEITSQEDLYFEGWVKHDGEHLYLAFDIRDDIFYGIETERWMPPQNPFTHVIGERERGRPWFGDMIEILIYGRMLDLKVPIGDVTGDGRGIQIIYNLTKSLEGGVGVPGMLPHGPNRTVENWENNKRWILEDIIETKTKRYDEANRYTVEIRIRLSGGIEISEGVYWSMETEDTPIGFNLAIGDVDTQDKSPDNSLHHETWWAGKLTSGDRNTRKKFWGLLVMTSKEKGTGRE
jgi:SSS family solute:Na+ symporter